MIDKLYCKLYMALRLITVDRPIGEDGFTRAIAVAIYLSEGER